MAKMTGAQALLESLKREKVEVMFGISGGALLPIHDVLCDSEIRHILARHEQGAAHMADGYARASGTAGVCMATSGPGATNIVTGLANAYLDSSPVIALTGQVPTYSANTSYMIGRDAFQEADIIGITTPITKYNVQVKHASEIPNAVKSAFYIATTGRPGPALVDLPKDTQTVKAEMDFSDNVQIRGYKPNTDPHPLQIKKAVNLLLNAERPMVLAGGGVNLSGASPELLQIAELLMMPVATTFMGKSCFPENHPLSMGNIGMHGTMLANKMILEADVLLAVGTRFQDRSTGTLNGFCPDAKIIHIDVDAAEIGKNVDVEVPIVGDAKPTLTMINQRLVKKVKKQKNGPWVKQVQAAKEKYLSELDLGSGDLTSPKLLKELRRLLPEQAIIATEVGQNQMWAALHFQTIKPRTFISSGGLGTMGFGFPAAIGAKVACPECPVVDIAGDGSFRMTEQELGTSVTEDIPVIVIVLNNSMLGMVAQWQRLFYQKRYAAVKLGNVPDFAKLAQAYGAEGVHIESLTEFSAVIKNALKTEVTTVIDVPISPDDDVFPMVPPGKGLKDTVGGL
ncbi:MAG: biosynthetic-type acetolactate synthase large subunit [Candidatus Bathyarchaeota archaeon]|nr:biosynthetic-type acetolactate synthase large subunit [Candidatus Bathyarchaeum tardum]WGM89064.1 MAG: biosynthetic-type acetolactate synthase large subunit [Candidatus Bathyarchaeum tardum]WNZ28699.1 MAG: biosynthetic-type acetolactate synthase large subunit [Candidatus Bathyarchaeota archaeon]